MSQCEGHKDLVDKVKEVKKELSEEIREVEKKLTDKIDTIQSERKHDREEFIETKTWVKSLFGEFENVTEELKNLASAMNKHQVNQAVNDYKTNKAMSFIESFTPGKIIAIALSIITILVAIKELFM